MVIGLTGSYAAGKDTIADYLKNQGFVYHSLSDMLREELNKLGKPIIRKNLIDIGNEIRTKFGAGELAKRVLAIIKENPERNSLIVSIRNPQEVRELKTHADFQMWFVDAPQKMRYERAAKRRRTDDFLSFEEFVAKENQENSDDPNAQQLNKVAQMADVTIINDSDTPSLYQKIDKLIQVKA